MSLLGPSRVTTARRRAAVGILFLLYALAPPMAAAQSPSSESDFVLVRRVIDARYAGFDLNASPPPKQVAQPGAAVDWSKVEARSALSLEKALRSEISREVVIGNQDSMQALVLREYGFGQSDSKTAYTAIERKILDVNGLSKPEDLVAGARLKVPALPPLSPTQPSEYNTRNLIPKTSMYSGLPGVVTGRSFDAEALTFRTRPQFSSALRKGAPLVVQYLWLPRETVEKERMLSGDDGPAIEVHAELVSARMEDGDATRTAGSFPTNEERNFIQAKLGAQPLQSPVLIVLDDGWPNDQAYQDSLRFVGEAFAAIERKFKYPYGPNVRALANSKSTTYPKATFHARSIAESLAPLTSLEPETAWDKRRVRVVYLPMTAAQANAAGLLEDIVALRLIDDLMGETRGDDPPPQTGVAALRTRAREIVSRLPKDIGVTEVTTDKAVIESVLWLADLYSRASGQPYVANFSWTTSKLRNRYADLRFNLGLLVTAAANSSASGCTKCRPHLAFKPDCDCADNVAAEERWFAVRAVDGQDVVAVMNTARDGSLQCRSSIVGSRTKEPMAIALDGLISPTICGTSFAAPRVGWLVAARLAYVDPKSLYSEEPDRGEQLRNIVKRSRVGGVTRGDQFNLDVQKLFGP